MKLVKLFKSEVRVAIEYHNPNSFIKYCHNNNINLNHIIYQNDLLCCNISYHDYEQLSKIYNIKIIKFLGYKYLFNYIKQNLIVIISIVIGIITIYFSSFFIVDIEINHENKELVNLINQELEKNHLHKFSIRKNYNELETIVSNIKKNNLDKIDWLEIKRVGMKYIVEVQERKLEQDTQELDYCGVYASKDGLISKVILSNGVAQVEKNDYVKKGDLLISGDIKLNEDIVDNVCASGQVYAEVWYIVNVKVPLKYYEEEKTNVKRYNYIVNINDIDYVIFNDRLADYKSEKQLIFNLLGIKIYRREDVKVNKTLKKYSYTEAEEKAMNIAKRKISLKLKNNDHIISEKVLQKALIDSTMDIDIFIVAEENVAQVVQLSKENINGNI